MLKRLKIVSMLIIIIFVGTIHFKSAAAQSSSAVGKSGRIALIIGNEDYRSGGKDKKAMAKVVNAKRDAQSVSQAFRKLGFTVFNPDNSEMPLIDVSGADLAEALKKFKVASQSSAVSVIYYTGHGISRDGKQYMLGIESDAIDDAELIPLSDALDALNSSEANILFLDACRAFVDAKGNPVSASELNKRRSSLLTFPKSNHGIEERPLVIMTASENGKYAWPSTKTRSNSSPFSYNLVEALKVSRSSVISIFYALSDRIPADTAKEGLTDTPQKPDIAIVKYPYVQFNSTDDDLRAIASEVPLQNHGVWSLDGKGIDASELERRFGTEDSVQILRKILANNTVSQVRQLADAGDVTAAYLLGVAYDNGAFVNRDPSAFKHWAAVAANADYSAGVYLLGYGHFTGRLDDGVEDYGKAEQYLTRAAQKNFPKADFLLYRLYSPLEDKTSIPADERRSSFINASKATGHLERAARAGHWDSMVELGSFLYDGNQLFSQNKERGIEILKRASALGSVGAKAKLCQINSSNSTPWSVDKNCLEAAQGGDRYALFVVGLGYLEGKWGAPRKDPVEAFRALDAAVSEDPGCASRPDLPCRNPPNPGAFCGLAKIYQSGIGVRRDQLKANLFAERAKSKAIDCSKYVTGK